MNSPSKYCVYYHTDYDDFGLQAFSTKEEAETFILNKRELARRVEYNCPSFYVVKGVFLDIVPVEIITKLEIQE